MQLTFIVYNLLYTSLIFTPDDMLLNKSMRYYRDNPTSAWHSRINKKA